MPPKTPLKAYTLLTLNPEQMEQCEEIRKKLKLSRTELLRRAVRDFYKKINAISTDK